MFRFVDCLMTTLVLTGVAPEEKARSEHPPAANAPAENSLLRELIDRGVRLQSGQFVRLPAPLVPDGLDAKQQEPLLRKAAGKHPLDLFVRHSVVAPFSLEINSVDDTAGKRSGQRADFYFVTYGTVDGLTDDNLLGELAGAQESRGETAGAIKVRTLTDEELRSRKLVPQNEGGPTESYVAIDVPILERVQLTGVGVGVRQKTDDSILGVWKLDDRFADDKTLPNRWQPILRDQVGKTTLGPAKPYSGLGGYIKVTRLHEPAGALLVECHLAFDEPLGWFDGKNLLRSKLPLVVQENVRTFRRKVAKASKQ